MQSPFVQTKAHHHLDDMLSNYRFTSRLRSTSSMEVRRSRLKLFEFSNVASVYVSKHLFDSHPPRSRTLVTSHINTSSGYSSRFAVYSNESLLSWFHQILSPPKTNSSSSRPMIRRTMLKTCPISTSLALLLRCQICLSSRRWC